MESSLTSLRTKEQIIHDVHWLRTVFAQHSDEGYDAGERRSLDRLLYGLRSYDVDDEIYAFAVGHFEDFGRPVRVRAIVDKVCRTQLLCNLQLLIR